EIATLDRNPLGAGGAEDGPGRAQGAVIAGNHREILDHALDDDLVAEALRDKTVLDDLQMGQQRYFWRGGHVPLGRLEWVEPGRRLRYDARIGAVAHAESHCRNAEDYHERPSHGSLLLWAEKWFFPLASALDRFFRWRRTKISGALH